METTEYKGKLLWAISSGVFDGLNVVELLAEPERHPAAWGALLYVLDGRKTKSGLEIKTNTSRIDAEKALPTWAREKAAAQSAVDRVVSGMMK